MTVQTQAIAATTGEAMSPSTALHEVRELLADKLRGKTVRIYEAGGGSLSVLPLSALDGYTVSVVDVDQVQLNNNTYADVKILGDIQTYKFPPNSFDLVMCHNVIEHLPHADKAVQRFYDALAPGGLLFISAPNPQSLSGFVTKYSPHWFHVWFYRTIFGDKNAGKPGHHPFPTFYHPIVTPKALLKYGEQVGFEAVYFNQFLSKHYAYLSETKPALGAMLNAVTNVGTALTFGHFNLALGDYHAVLQKPMTSKAS